MNTMTRVTEIGLPQLTEEDIERLTEQCEQEITRFIFQMVPQKSIAELNVVCTLDLSDVLTLDVDLDITQKYDTGHSLDEILEQAAAHGQDWLERRLMEMKNK